MMSCGPVSYLAIAAVALLAFVLVAAICAVVLGHRDRVRAARRDPLCGEFIKRASGGCRMADPAVFDDVRLGQIAPADRYR